MAAAAFLEILSNSWNYECRKASSDLEPAFDEIFDAVASFLSTTAIPNKL